MHAGFIVYSPPRSAPTEPLPLIVTVLEMLEQVRPLADAHRLRILATKTGASVEDAIARMRQDIAVGPVLILRAA